MRDDDLDAYEKQLRGPSTDKVLAFKRKPLNVWRGEAVAPLDGPPGSSIITMLNTGRWVRRVIAFEPDKFIRYELQYTARGANANDAAKYVSKLVGCDEKLVQVRTTSRITVNE